MLAKTRQLVIILVVFMLTACSNHSPEYSYYNSPGNSAIKGAALGGLSGAAIGFLAKTKAVATWSLVGAGVGLYLGYASDTETAIIERLHSRGVQAFMIGEEITVIFPSDSLFFINSARIRHDQYVSLIDVVQLLQSNSLTPVEITAYTDNVGSRHHTKALSQAQAEKIAGYFWSHGIERRRLHPIGAGESPDVAENTSSQGSAYNRRLVVHIKKYKKFV